MTINGRIVFLRQRLGLSQRVFGEQIGRSVAYVSKVESGRMQPSDKVIRSIADAFGVDEDWLRTGEGKLEVESVGDRVKLARKARDYTQEELAEELFCSRNTVGMIERGTVRPGEELLDGLCDRLWINRNWLLTGQGEMERTELTPIYELLKKDLRIRRHIKDYIDHLDKPQYRDVAGEEEKEEPRIRMTTAYVNDIAAAKLFFRDFNIPYEQIESGKDAGKLRVRALRDIDHEKAHDVMKRCSRARIQDLCDHEYTFRDADDNTIVTFSPYDYEEVPKGKTWIEKSEYSIYGHGTTTFVVRC